MLRPQLVLFPYELKNEVLHDMGKFVCLGLAQSTPILGQGVKHPTISKSTSDYPNNPKLSAFDCYESFKS